ncbi:glycosyltransferase family 2 protein [Natronorubrum sp. DTA7]|uniref:glycosyltransferase family 2 protein n=1 Tax=Natronorubrum sp. DTA7 TaxID=3447016 RepID=UPI003F845325
MCKISVIIPAYNRADVLSRTIDSVLGQTFDDFEVIVVDDGSEDKTPQVAQSYDSPKLTYERFNENKGANAARNRGIELAVGDYISFLDSDDEFLPNNLKQTYEAIKKTADDCAGVFTAARKYRNGELIYETSVGNTIITLEDISEGNVIGGFSRFMCKSSIFEGFRLDESVEAGQAYNFHLRILKQGYVMKGIDNILVNHYFSDNSITNDVGKLEKGHEHIINAHSDIVSKKRIAEQHYYRALRLSEQGDMSSASSELKHAIKADPTGWKYYLHYIPSLLGKRTFDVFLNVKDSTKNVRGR